ncbi:MAG: hypothetical protein GY801_13660 [bacterium]|nr:hypothetical protein [bacterium]
MNNAERILTALDRKLNACVELTLYGRAALFLGFESPPQEYALSKDVDAVFWKGQAEMLLETTNFWEAVNAVNRELADQELYISHFFEETQVILRPNWREQRVKINQSWNTLILYRLGDIDLLLSKLMRDDPIDLEDALFIYEHGTLDTETLKRAFQETRIPDIPEIKEQFELASQRFLRSIKSERYE